MNKKGFTLIELITTFALASIIFVMLINVVLLIKDIYIDSNIKTELLINQSNLSNALNSKLRNKNVKSYSVCTDSDFCYKFKLADDNEIKLIVTDGKIKFGNYTYTLVNGTRIETPTFEAGSSFLNIKIPIKNKKYSNDDYGINLVYLGYVSNTTS